MDSDDERIRARAYELWDGDGRQHGRDEEHWLQAERALGAAGAFLFLLSAAHLAKPDLDPSWRPISEYALGDFGARILDAPMPSGSFTRWGSKGRGRWMTVYADSGHMFIVIAGLRFDTSQTRGAGPGWSSNVRAGFANVSKRSARHWKAL